VGPETERAAAERIGKMLRVTGCDISCEIVAIAPTLKPLPGKYSMA
jgi:hypothetical protein